jgi:hypothetical protein
MKWNITTAFLSTAKVEFLIPSSSLSLVKYPVFICLKKQSVFLSTWKYFSCLFIKEEKIIYKKHIATLVIWKFGTHTCTCKNMTHLLQVSYKTS